MHSITWLLLFLPYCLKTCNSMNLPDQKSLEKTLFNSIPDHHDLLLDALDTISDEGRLENIDPLNAKWRLLSCNDYLPPNVRFLKCNKKRSVSESKSSANDADLSKRESKLKKVRFFSWGGKRGDHDEMYNNYYPDEIEIPQNIFDTNELDFEQELAKRAQTPQKVRIPFNSWGGKRKEQLKKVRFFSWGGKRSPDILVKSRKAPKVPFFSWGGKRSYMPEESDYIEM